MGFSRLAALVAPWSVVLVACASERICTEIGCVDGVSLLASTESGRLADGTYAITLQLDATSVACTLDATDLSTNRNRSFDATCDTESVRVAVRPQRRCEERRTEEAIGQVCTTLEGQWELQVDVPGTPSSVRVAVARDGVVLVEQSVTLGYQEVQPNGAECGPVCRQASPQPLVLREG